jgi:hypothetical protein
VKVEVKEMKPKDDGPKLSDVATFLSGMFNALKSGD